MNEKMLVNIVSTKDDLDLKFIKHLQYINIIDHYQLHQKQNCNYEI